MRDGALSDVTKQTHLPVEMPLVDQGDGKSKVL